MSNPVPLPTRVRRQQASGFQRMGVTAARTFRNPKELVFAHTPA